MQPVARVLIVGRSIVTLVIALLIAAPAAGAHFGFTVTTPDGDPVRDAEICAFAGGGAPLEEWFSDGDVRCFPATTVVAFPPGKWNVFAMVAGQYASVHPYVIPVNEDPRNTDTGYREIAIDVVPAATVRVGRTPASGERIVIYFPGTKETLPFAIPLRPGDGTITVPAGFAFLPARVAGTRVIAFGNLHPGAKVGSAVTLDDFDRTSTTDLVTWLALTQTPARFKGPPTRELSPPEIRFTSGSRSFPALIPNGPVRDRELVIVKNIDPASRSGVLHLSGATWEAAEVPVTSGERAALVVAPPLRLAPAAEVRVTLSPAVLEWLRDLAATDCHRRGEAAETPRNEIELTGGSPQIRDLADVLSEGSIAFPIPPALPPRMVG